MSGWKVTVRRERAGLHYHRIADDAWKHPGFRRALTLDELESEFGPTIPVDVDRVEALLADYEHVRKQLAEAQVSLRAFVEPGGVEWGVRREGIDKWEHTEVQARRIQRLHHHQGAVLISRPTGPTSVVETTLTIHAGEFDLYSWGPVTRPPWPATEVADGN